MKFKTFLVFLLAAALLNTAEAGSINMTVKSPLNNASTAVGQPITLDYNAEIEMTGTGAQLIVGGRHLDLYYVDLTTSQQKRYITTVNTAGFPAGPAILRIEGYRHDANGDFYIAQKEINIFFSPAEQPDSNAGASVVRVLPDVVYPGGFAYFSLLVFPKKPFPGIILGEKIPASLTFFNAWGYEWGGTNYDYDFNGNTIKIVARNAGNIPNTVVIYSANIPNNLAPGATINWGDGNWAIEGEKGPITGDTETRVGGFAIPSCPLSDEVLLQYITRWSREEVNNAQLLQIIERWNSC